MRSAKPRCYAVVALIVLAMPLTTVAQGTGVDAGEQPLASEDAAPSDDVEVDAGEQPLASEDSAPADDVEVIQVLGTPQSGIDIDAPTSATQFDAEDLQMLGVGDISDLTLVTPNLEIRTAGSTAPTFFIRGVGLSDFSSIASGAVAIYQDGVALNAPALQLGQLFDLENVEVLRGPQGSGAGRNASAGAIKVNSRKPTGGLNASLLASYGNYNAVDLEGAVGAPILEDILSARVAFRFSQRDGWGKNRCGGLPPLQERMDDYELGNPDTTWDREFCDETLGLVRNPDWQVGDPQVDKNFREFSDVPGGLETDVNDVGTWAVRGLLRFQPDKADMDWLLIAHGGRLDQLSELGQVVGTKSTWGTDVGFPTGETGRGYRDPDIAAVADRLQADCLLTNPDAEACSEQVNTLMAREIAENLDSHPKDGDYNRTGDTTLDTWGVSLSGEIGLGDNIRLTTITAFDSYDRFRDEDYDFTPETIFEDITVDDGWQVFQQFSFTGEIEEYPFGWEAGGYTLVEQLTSSSDFFTGPLPRTQGGAEILYDSNETQRFSQDMWSFGIYAGFNWEFLDDFRLEGGVRYNWEKKDFSLALNEGRPTGGQIDDSEVWQAPTGTISLIYQARDDVSVYWKYSRGWKGGQFNASTIQLDTPTPPANPETIDAWEIGMNGYLFDGRLGLSAALFYYKYDQYQVFIVEDNLGAFPQLQVINANEAQVYGAEFEARYEPLADLVPEAFDQLSVGVRLGWLESEFLDFTNSQLRQLSTGRPPNPPNPRTLPVTMDFSGNQLINAPRFKLSLEAQWSFLLGSLGTITPRYDGAWSDDIFFDATEGRGSPNAEGTTVLPEFAVGQPAFWLHNLSLQYRTPNEDVELTAWVRNLTDKEYATFAFDATGFGNLVVNYVGEPRTFGLSLAFYF
jgi:outer membrane receptor protein involved in Fe transport